MNSIVIIGKLKEGPTLKEIAGGLKLAQGIFEAPRSYSNGEGKDFDLFQISFWKGLAEEALKLPEDVYIAIKGRLQANNFTKDDGTTIYRNEIVAEKICRLD